MDSTEDSKERIKNPGLDKGGHVYHSNVRVLRQNVVCNDSGFGSGLAAALVVKSSNQSRSFWLQHGCTAPQRTHQKLHGTAGMHKEPHEQIPCAIGKEGR